MAVKFKIISPTELAPAQILIPVVIQSVINKNEPAKKVIYSNGDSFSSGVGSCDELYVDNFKSIKYGDYTPAEYNKLKADCLEKNFNNDHHRLIALEKEKAYLKSVAKMLDMNLINSSEGGSSQSAILYRTLLDLARLKALNQLPDLTIIHLTNELRITLIDQNHFQRRSSDVTGSREWLVSYLLTWSTGKVRPLLDEIVKCQEQNELLVQFLLEVALLNIVVKEATGKYPLLFLTSSKIFADLEALRSKEELQLLLELSRIYYIDRSLIQTEVCGNNLVLVKNPCGHYNQESNDKFAHSVTKYIKEHNLV